MGGGTVMIRIMIVFAMVCQAMTAYAIQDAPSNPIADAYVPSRPDFGEGWQQRNGFTSTDDLDLTAFQVLERRFYGGPAGARIELSIRPLADTPGSQLRAWTIMGEIADAMAWELDGGFTTQRNLQSMAPPPGCLDAMRVTGVDFFGYPASLTICARDDVMLSTLVSGELPNLSTIEASDHVIALCIAAAKEAK